MKIAIAIRVGLFVLGIALVACGADQGDEEGCDPTAGGRCVGDVIQVCVSNAATRSFQWVDVLDCHQMWGDVCQEPEAKGAMPACVEAPIEDAGTGTARSR